MKRALGLIASVAAAALLTGCSNPRGHIIALLKAGAPLTVHPIRANAFWVSGGLSNSGFIVGDRGVIVIDAEAFIKTAKTLQARIRDVSPKPVETVILTHSDPDHVNGLAAFPRGVQVLAQANLMADVRHELAAPKAALITPPETADYLPARPVPDLTTLTIDGVRISLIHVAPAHTDSDLIVFVPDQRIVFAGDILVPSVTPYAGIHREKRGSIMGWMAMMSSMLALDADIFIPGHGDPMSRPQVEACLRLTKARYEQVQTMVAQHMTVDQIKTALREPRPKGVAAMFPTFVENAYAEITEALPTAAH